MRARIPRKIRFRANADYFKPLGIPMRQLKEIELTREEMEAVRLRDYKDIEQIDSAKKMGISQSTFFRELRNAHKKIATALIDGAAIKIKKE